MELESSELCLAATVLEFSDVVAFAICEEDEGPLKHSDVFFPPASQCPATVEREGMKDGFCRILEFLAGLGLGASFSAIQLLTDCPWIASENLSPLSLLPPILWLCEPKHPALAAPRSLAWTRLLSACAIKRSVGKEPDSRELERRKPLTQAEPPDPICCYTKGVCIEKSTTRFARSGLALGVSFGPKHPWNISKKLDVEVLCDLSKKSWPWNVELAAATACLERLRAVGIRDWHVQLYSNTTILRSKYQQFLESQKAGNSTGDANPFLVRLHGVLQECRLSVQFLFHHATKDCSESPGTRDAYQLAAAVLSNKRKNTVDNPDYPAAKRTKLAL